MTEKLVDIFPQDLADELRQAIRLFSQRELEVRLAGLFKSARDMRIYELSDGSRTTREIANLTNSDRTTVSNLWQSWSGQDLVESSGSKKPYKRKFSLFELALIQETGDKK